MGGAFVRHLIPRPQLWGYACLIRKRPVECMDMAGTPQPPGMCEVRGIEKPKNIDNCYPQPAPCMPLGRSYGSQKCFAAWRVQHDGLSAMVGPPVASLYHWTLGEWGECSQSCATRCTDNMTIGIKNVLMITLQRDLRYQMSVWPDCCVCARMDM